MDPNEFKQQLEQFAEVKQVKVAKNAGLREADEPDIVFRNGQEFTISKDNNPTLSWAIKKLKPQIRNCEDCNLIVENRVTYIRICQYPEAHWRETCQACGMTRNPDNGKFDLQGQDAKNYFTAAIKEKKSVSIIKFRKPTK